MPPPRLRLRISSRIPLVTLAAVCGLATATFAAEPEHKDTKDKFKPKMATFTVSLKPAEARPGDVVTYSVTAKVDQPWHIYNVAEMPRDDGPKATAFDLFEPEGLAPQGEWTASRKPIRKHEAAFETIDFLEYFEDEITWSLKLKVPEGAEPGKKAVRSQVLYMLCSPKGCTVPVYHSLPAATLTVKPGGAAASPLRIMLAAMAVGAAEEPEVPSVPAATGVQGAIDRGLLPFLAYSALGGLFALLMPCVWPMVPVTVNFFVKQGQANGGKGTARLALTYCLAIIGIFTAVGLLFSIFLGASSLTRLANSAWLNLAVAGIFLAFGLSLLGLFEISLPSWLLNASAKGESRGGLIGVVFMALTLTITSFTCTFQVVGFLLVLASRGSYLYPVLGLATFATVLATPFFLLALAPGLLAKMPRSGDWMNAIKVVGGLIEVGAAFKFVNTAEIALGSTPDTAWFDSSVLLSIWVVLSLVCGLYLLGLFKTDHDYGGEKGVGAGRIVAGAAFLSLALYLAPALFGFPPRSRVYDRLVLGLLPADSGKLDASARIAMELRGSSTEGGASVANVERAVKATSQDPRVAITEEKTVHGVRWGMSYEAALAEAKAKWRPVLVDFTGVNCANCRLMEKSVMPRPEVVAELKKFVPVQLYTDFVPIDSITRAQREALAEANLEREQELTNETTSPLYVALDAEGKVLAVSTAVEAPAFVKFLETALGKHKAMAGGVAKVGG